MLHQGPPSKHHRCGPPAQYDYLFFGPIGRETYLGYWPSKTANRLSPLDQLTEKFTGSGEESTQAAAARQQFFANFNTLLTSLRTSTQQLVVEELYNKVKEISPLAAQQLDGDPPTGLGLHLKEITEFSKSFYLVDGKSRFPDIMNDRHALLFAEVVAPVHDLLKYLGSLESQIAFDHEVFTAELVKHVFPGKQVKLGGVDTTLSAADVEFIAAVVSDHENLYKELGRDGWSRSQDPYERAKALFFVADTLTGAIQPIGNSGVDWKIDAEQLKVRFVDLYFRHIDPVKGKTFRPEWGLYAVKDLSNTLKHLSEHEITIQGTNPQSSARESLVKAALDGVDQALKAQDARRSNKTSLEKSLTDAQVEHVRHVQQELSKLRVEQIF